MQKDFHYYVIYLLARKAGFESQEAYTIAYASQFTDDAFLQEPIHLPDGRLFIPSPTSHNYHGIEWYSAMSQKVGFEVWMPFHFVPGLESETNSPFEKLRVKPVSLRDGSLLDRILQEIKETRNKPFSLHLLGICLHVLADTWSHQGFIGLTCKENDVSELEIEGKKKFSFFGDLLRFIEEELEEAIHDVFPKTGHAEALFIPDEPYRKWTYSDFWGKRQKIDNVERSIRAARECWLLLKEFRGEEPNGFEKIETHLVDHLTREGNLEERCRWWQEAIKGGLFFTPLPNEQLIYDANIWFKEAITKENDFLEAKSNFEKSALFMFYQAANFYHYLWKQNFPFMGFSSEKLLKKNYKKIELGEKMPNRLNNTQDDKLNKQTPSKLWIIVPVLIPFIVILGGLGLLYFGIVYKTVDFVLDLGCFCLLSGILSFLMYLDFYYSCYRLMFEQQGEDHTGISGYRRSILALAIILVFAWVLFRMVFPHLEKTPENLIQNALQNALGVLAGVLASLAGFYFGGKTAKRETKK